MQQALLMRGAPMVRTLFKFNGDLSEETGLIGAGDWSNVGYVDFVTLDGDEGVRIASGISGPSGLKTNFLPQLDPGSADFAFEVSVVVDGYYGRFYPLFALVPQATPNITYELIANTDGVSGMYPYFAYPTSATTTGYISIPSLLMVYGQRYHIRVNRVGDLYRIFIDGVEMANSTGVAYRHARGNYAIEMGNAFPPNVDQLYGKLFWSRYVKNTSLNGVDDFTVPSEPTGLSPT
jgi:hypothetical protein